MDVLGIDFTSTPKSDKPLIRLSCSFDGQVLLAGDFQEWSTFSAFEEALQRPGPWIAGIDFPFGQSRRFIETIGWRRTDATMSFTPNRWAEEAFAMSSIAIEIDGWPATRSTAEKPTSPPAR
jgi:hypothetical protein